MENVFGNVFVLDSLKKDLLLLTEKIKEEKPDFILGVAKSNKNYSIIEQVAVNTFNKKGTIDKTGKKILYLNIPKNISSKFFLSKRSTTSFCNYSMYKMQTFLEDEHLSIPFSFVHVLEKDISFLHLLVTNTHLFKQQ